MWAHRRNSKPADEFEDLRIKIESRRLRRRHKLHKKVKIDAAAYASAGALHAGDEITRHINPVSWHHGIYIGDGKVCDRNTDTPPNVVTLEHFLEGQEEFEVVQYKRDSAEARADTLAIAMMATRDTYWTDAPYDVLGNNCEHFTNFCRVGKKYSRQAAAYAGGAAATLTTVAGAGLIGTGVIMYGAYRGANHLCKKMVSTADGEDTHDGDSEATKAAAAAAAEDSSSSENDSQTSDEGENAAANDAWRAGAAVSSCPKEARGTVKHPPEDADSTETE